MKLRIEWLFAVLTALTGTILVFLTPPMQIPDEPNHFWRAYQISEGIFRAPSKERPDVNGTKIYFYTQIPASLIINPIVDKPHCYDISKLPKFLTVPLDENVRHEVFIPGSGNYSPLVYAPQAVGIFIAREIFGSVGTVFYAARLGALIFSLICVTTALKLLPEKKLLIFVVAMSPMFLFEAAAGAADAIVNSLAILGATYLLSLRKKSVAISTREFFLLIVLALALGLAKQLYGTILILFLLIPAERFGGRRKFLLAGLAILAAYFISALGWMAIAGSGAKVSPFMAPFEGVDLARQAAFIKNSPLEFLQILWNTLVTQEKFYFESFIGILGWLKIRLPDWFYYFYAALLICGGIFGTLELKICQRALIFFAALPTILATMIYIYVTWTPVAGSTILGVQGRYFIPIAPLILLPLSSVKNSPYEILIAAIAGFSASAVTVYSVAEHFY